ncbi:MAG: hypothetical protein IT303_18865 [Dehalococcoidia bacterium]|nr:hypothetical protein [Dehalococcoidia bacterium]
MAQQVASRPVVSFARRAIALCGAGLLVALLVVAFDRLVPATPLLPAIAFLVALTGLYASALWWWSPPGWDI